MTDGINGIGGIAGPGGIGEADETPYQGSQSQQIQDQIQASDDIAALLYMMPAQTPSPVAPNQNSSMDPAEMAKANALATLASRFNDVQSEIIQGILDSWIEQLEESSKRTREWLQSPQYQVWLENKFPHLNPDMIKHQVEIQNEIRTVRGYAAEAIRGSTQNGEVPAEMAAVALGGLMIGGGVVAVSVPLGISLPAITSLGVGMGIIRSVVSSDVLSAQLGYIGGMLLAGIGAKSSVNALLGGIANGKMNTRALAEEYASRVIGMVTHRGFEAHILNRITGQLTGEKTVGQEQMVTTIKILMLANAIALLKKAEEGWLGPKMGELLLSGAKELDLPADSIQAKLYGEISAQLHSLSPQQRSKMVSALDAYFESEPALADLTDINSTFAAIAMRPPHTDIAEK